jgi:outer membrane protein
MFAAGWYNGKTRHLRQVRLSFLAVAATFLIPFPAQAFFEDVFELKQFSLRIGPAVIYNPVFEGARNYNAHILPSIDFRWKRLVFFHDNSVKVDFLQKPWASLGPIITYSSGRKESSSPALAGLGNVGKGIEVGGFAESVLGPIALRFDLQKEVAGGHGGLIGHFTAGFRVYKDDKLSIFPGARISYGSGKYSQSFFGVTAAQSALSGLPAYRAGSGLKDIGLGVITNYLISDHWTFSSVTAYSRLLGGVAASPLVKERGSANQFMQVARLSYLF